MFVQCLQDHVWCRSTIISGCIFLENYCSIWHSTGNYLYVKIITFLPRCSIDFPHFHTYWYILVHVLKITSMNSDSNMCASLFKFYMYELKSKKAWFQLSLISATDNKKSENYWKVSCAAALIKMLRKVYTQLIVLNRCDRWFLIRLKSDEITQNYILRSSSTCQMLTVRIQKAWKQN